MYKTIIRPILFLFKPETIHDVIFLFFKIINKIPGGLRLVKTLSPTCTNPSPTQVFGINFPNKVGLAAGLDKNAEAFDIFGNMGFGFVEIGTLTPKAQPGNPKPRLFRLPKNKALINRMGFNNRGLEHAVGNLKKRKTNVVVAGNIGKNKLTPNEQAYLDYLEGFEALFDFVDFFVVNVSSPNTPNLRELQDKKPLLKILSELQTKNLGRTKPKPILLKIAPDLGIEQLNDVLEIIEQTKLAGIVATNTTIERNKLAYDHSYIESIGAGGLSGQPLFERSTEIIKYISDKTSGKLPIIAVGGIFSADDAQEKMQAGASLVQIYTSFIYEGPKLIKDIACKI